MTHAEKAAELIEKFGIYVAGFDDKIIRTNAKHCAIIAVKEILKCNPMSDEEYSTISYWMDVLTELEKM